MQTTAPPKASTRPGEMALFSIFSFERTKWGCLLEPSCFFFESSLSSLRLNTDKMRRVLGQSTHMIGKRNVGGFLSRAVRPSPSSSIVFGARNVHTFFSTFASTTPLSSASLSAQHQRHFHTSQHDPNTAYATTILAVRKNGEVVLIGDGQVCVRLNNNMHIRM
jgi:hypothetical protein